MLRRIETEPVFLVQRSTLNRQNRNEVREVPLYEESGDDEGDEDADAFNRHRYILK